MKWAIQAKEEEKNKPQTFTADGWTGNQRSSQMWWRNEQELLSPEPRTARNKWAEWLGRGEREGDKGRGKGIRRLQPGQKGAFYPGWWLQPGQKAARAFCPGWCLQPGQKALSPPLARLAVGPGTKATYCPGTKGCRDKWPGTKAYSLVVFFLYIYMNVHLL